MREPIKLHTQSLLIREFTLDDVHPLYSLTRQPEITDILPEWKMSIEQIQDFLNFVIGNYAGFDPADVRILLAIEHPDNRQLIGWCGVFPNEMLPPEEREVAYAISKDYRNRGYTTEAVRAVLSYVFDHSSLDRVVAIVKPYNVQSRRVAEKAGFQYKQTLKLSDGSDYDYLAMHRERSLSI